MVLTSLPSSEAVKAAYLGSDGEIASEHDELFTMDTSTVHPKTSERVASELGARGIPHLDVPVSGGPENCREGTLSIMVGGARGAYRRDDAQAVLETLGTTVTYAGESNAGHVTKLVNNLISMGNLLLAMEAVSLGVDCGVDAETLVSILGRSGAASNAFEKRMPRVLNRNFELGFTVDFARKDLSLAVEVAADETEPMLLGSLIQQLFTEASCKGLGERDVSAVVQVFEERRQLTVESDGHVEEQFGGY